MMFIKILTVIASVVAPSYLLYLAYMTYSNILTKIMH